MEELTILGRRSSRKWFWSSTAERNEDRDERDSLYTTIALLAKINT